MFSGKIRRVFIVVVFLTFFSGISAGKVIFVDDDAPDGGNGQSWASAYRFLQDALTTASVGDLVLVAQGVYKPDQDALHPEGSGSLAALFMPKMDMVLKGGYAGVGAVDPNERDVKAYKTILSGDLAGDDNYVADPSLLMPESPPRDPNDDPRIRKFPIPIPTRSDNSWIIMILDYKETGVVLDGLEFTGSYRYSALVVSNLNKDVTIRDCSFYNNCEYFGETNFGGAISGSDMTVTGCTFERNASSWGGAVSGSGLFENCEFVNNYTYSTGGALDLYNSTVKHCNFLRNRSGGGGGAIKLDGDNPIYISYCVFRDNESSAGGAISNSGNAVIEKCTFINNTSSIGGISYCFHKNITFSNCLMYGNRAVKHGGIVARERSSVKIDKCTIIDNFAPYGRFLSTYKISEKWAPSNISISSCIIKNSGNEIWNEYGNINVTYTNIPICANDVCYDPNQGITWGSGNIDTDPCFADPGYWDTNGTTEDPNDDFYVEGDYHLKSQGGHWDTNSGTWVQDDVTSPCIDAGDPNSPIGLELFPNGGIINMGAYGGTLETSKSYFGTEHCETIIAGDINGDCQVDFIDLSLLFRHWLESGNY